MALEPANGSESAASARLRYVSDDRPGIRRVKTHTGFRYVGPDGQPIRDSAAIERIKAIAIPPAWTDVWICPVANGHIQATGRDARGRKQYRYHPRWHATRDEAKYDRLLAFAEALPRIRRRVARDLDQPGVPRTRVLATVVKLLEETSIRVGNQEYRKTNNSFGLTTMRDRHARFESAGTLRFEFDGKGGRHHSVKVTDRRLVRIVKHAQDVPGQELFQYVDDDGARHAIESSDINDYLRDISQSDFTAKDFRTWNGTVLAMRYLRASEAPGSETAGKRLVATAIKSVAADLGNTPAVCRKAYVHPVVMNAYLEGWLEPEAGVARSRPSSGLTAEERRVVELLRRSAAESNAA